MFYPQLAIWTLGAISLGAGIAPAATPAAGSGSATVASSLTTFRKQVEEVRVVFAVRDGRKLVKDVDRDELTFLDNGQQPAAITTFQQDSNLPLQVALLIDHSDSMQKGFAGEQQAAREFLERFLRPGVDSVFVVDFSMTVSVSPLQTGDSGQVQVGGLQASGQTALYDAIVAASRSFTDNTNSQGPSRRVILLLSDGEDNYSRASYAEAVQAVQRADAAVYAVTAHNSHYEYRGDSVLRHLTGATGGRAFILGSYSGVNSVFSQIE